MSDPAPLAWQLGEELLSQTLEPVTRLQLIKYAGASGDYNPIHTIDQAAADAGLPGVIAHGMLTMATMGRLFSSYLDRGFIQHFETRFAGMVFVGDTLTIGGRVTGSGHTDQGTTYLFDAYAKNQKGHLVATGKVTLLIYPER